MRVASEQRDVDGVGNRFGCCQHEGKDRQHKEDCEWDHSREGVGGDRLTRMSMALYYSRQLQPGLRVWYLDRNDCGTSVVWPIFTMTYYRINAGMK